MQFDYKTPKIIGDPIHGYIPLTDLEYQLIQLPTLTRLHSIHQTSAAYLTFPGSVATRFSHVVGAMTIGSAIIEKILYGMEESDYKKLFSDIPSEFIIKSIRLACLFHDIGHGPFSHSAEHAMLEVVKKLHSSEIDEAKKLFEVQDESKLPIHEFYTYKLITNGEISDLIEKHKDGGKELKEFTADLIVKAKQSEISKNNSKGYNLIRKIVSGQLDADRMDYLLRDSMMSGVKFGQIDIDRIIENIAIKKNQSDVYQLVFHERAIGNIEEMLDARYKMYRYFYNHHTVVATNALLDFAIKELINESDDIAELFHWTSYAKGYSIDEYILQLLRDRIEDEKYLRCKGLVDRRYLPISIFKSTLDFRRLIEEIKNISSIHERNEAVTLVIKKFFKEADGGEKIKKALEDKGGDLTHCELFSSSFTMKPYQWFSLDKDKVYLYRENNSEFCELYSESTYFQKINQEWEKFYGFYLFYIIPNMEKIEFAKHKNEVRKIIANEIAEYYKNL